MGSRMFQLLLMSVFTVLFMNERFQLCHSCDYFNGLQCLKPKKYCWKLNILITNRSCATEHFYFYNCATAQCDVIWQNQGTQHNTGVFRALVMPTKQSPVPGLRGTICSFTHNPPIMRLTSCTSCDEYIGKNCRKNLGSCQPRYPDLACQTKEVYSHHYTGDYIYQYSVLGCPRRCAEYTRITPREKIVFFCCNTSRCNSLPVKDVVPFNPIATEV
ncbi:hypothetical protein MJG53_016730 [Ovis ammon polii x Ovis aries]|uniref:Uncharacterized protein n=1 Tax=Ovis ammon polii x Ovis aries TaxID=2918886 RepID=A0ACB9UA22_9CETA|nr:hypothetical protein MJG53_016730 [Ovis ammon polii x Ovis aries]